MTPQDYENALDKLQKKHDNLLMELGKMEFLHHERIEEVYKLERRAHQLMTNIKSLTTQLTKAKEKVLRLDDTLGCLIEIVAAARQISPDVSDRIDNIIDDVNPLLKDKI